MVLGFNPSTASCWLSYLGSLLHISRPRLGCFEVEIVARSVSWYAWTGCLGAILTTQQRCLYRVLLLCSSWFTGWASVLRRWSKIYFVLWWLVSSVIWVNLFLALILEVSEIPTQAVLRGHLFLIHSRWA